MEFVSNVRHVKKCPKQAKYFDDPAFLSHVEMLKRNYQRAVKNEIFVSDGREMKYNNF